MYKNYEVKIYFSGDSIITLILEAIEVIMQDLGRPWMVKSAPSHKIWMLNYIDFLNKTLDKKRINIG